MKKVLSIFLLLIISAAAFAQQKDVTKFLGIPVDGTKQEMIQKLKAKGFKYDSTYDFFEGEFNGAEVILYVQTNNNKVWRILVMDKIELSEADIKIRFNNLYGQFENNKKYIPMEDYQALAEDENISYGMTIGKKRYDAVFFQKLDNFDPSITEEEYTKAVSNKSVWFKISEGKGYGKYKIVMYYENGYNQANGEDL